MIVPGMLLSQNFTIRTDILDSMIWEVKRGRSCDTLQQTQKIVIQKQGAELIANGDAIIILKSESSKLDALLKNCEALGVLNQEKFTIQKDSFKDKIKKLIRIIVVEGVVIVVMIILLV